MRMVQNDNYDVRKVTKGGQLRLGDKVEWVWGRHVIVMEREGKIILDPVEVEG